MLYWLTQSPLKHFVDNCIVVKLIYMFIAELSLLLICSNSNAILWKFTHLDSLYQKKSFYVHWKPHPLQLYEQSKVHKCTFWYLTSYKNTIRLQVYIQPFSIIHLEYPSVLSRFCFLAWERFGAEGRKYLTNGNWLSNNPISKKFGPNFYNHVTIYICHIQGGECIMPNLEQFYTTQNL